MKIVSHRLRFLTPAGGACARASSGFWIRFAILLALASAAAACGKSKSSAEKRTEPAPEARLAQAGGEEKRTATEADRANAGDDLDNDEKDRPAVLIFVDGGPDNATVWRGWPVLVEVKTLSGAAPAEELRVQGPSAVTPVRGKTLWVIPAATTAQLAPGIYRFAIGGEGVEVSVQDVTAPLTPADEKRLRRLTIQCALALEDTETAKSAAKAWIVAEPAFYEAHAALGDVLRATEDHAGAVAAYNEAIRV